MVLALQLVLLGGQTGAEVEGHDWERILLLTGALHRDHQLAGTLSSWEPPSCWARSPERSA
jgi:hypothetical protein